MFRTFSHVLLRRNFRVALCVIASALTACARAPHTPSLQWTPFTDQAAVFQHAKDAHQPVMWLFSTSWCPYCLRLKETLFTHPKVVAELAQWTVTEVDGDLDAANAAMQRWHVAGFPTIVFTTAEGAPLGAWQEVTNADTFVAQLQKMRTAQPNETDASWEQLQKNQLPGEPIPADHFWDEGEKWEKEGDLPAARASYRQGGLEGLAAINHAKNFASVRSNVSPTIQLLIRGGALAEAESLSRRAIEQFPEDFLYYHRLASTLAAQARNEEAIAAAESAFARSRGRNKTWVAQQLVNLLIAAGNKPRAKIVIDEALAAVDWSTNPRQKERGIKTELERIRSKEKL